jgi:hypothetical protein
LGQATPAALHRQEQRKHSRRPRDPELTCSPWIEFSCCVIRARYPCSTGQFLQVLIHRRKAVQQSYLLLGGPVFYIERENGNYGRKLGEVPCGAEGAQIKMSPNSAEIAPSAARRYIFVHTAYLATVGVATVGWLWLIAWVAFQLV